MTSGPDISNEEINTRIGTNVYGLYGNSAQQIADRDALAGRLSQETLDNALNATNFMRYSAGLQLLYINTKRPCWRLPVESAGRCCTDGRAEYHYP